LQTEVSRGSSAQAAKDFFGLLTEKEENVATALANLMDLLAKK